MNCKIVSKLSLAFLVCLIANATDNPASAAVGINFPTIRIQTYDPKAFILGVDEKTKIMIGQAVELAVPSVSSPSLVGKTGFYTRSQLDLSAQLQKAYGEWLKDERISRRILKVDPQFFSNAHPNFDLSLYVYEPGVFRNSEWIAGVDTGMKQPGMLGSYRKNPVQGTRSYLLVELSLAEFQWMQKLGAQELAQVAKDRFDVVLSFVERSNRVAKEFTDSTAAADADARRENDELSALLRAAHPNEK